ncbi:MAG: hypothetical protein EHM70_25770 [Chloroflexota bacterium]|nr:MAG: hypothetical protein EHM70_25770 [Chloroflexota bacterium]
MNAFVHSSTAFGETSQVFSTAWWSYLIWILAAAVLGFAVSRIFAGWLRLPRAIFLIPYVVFVSIFAYGYWQWSGLSVAELLVHNWIWGIIGALLFGFCVVRNIFSQPISPRAAGLPLAFDLLWSGIIYGGMDALLLSILPVLAAWQSFSALGWTTSFLGKLLVGAIALLLSLFVTVSYHLGFPEYRVPGGLRGPSIGNGVMSLGYLLTNNPLTAILSHIAMHIAGVLRGPASVMQLPPHYSKIGRS